MIRHLTPSDYTTMPWANGKGVTVEMLRVEISGAAGATGATGAGAVKWRLSRASVVENGDFSRFPGINRNLTVITGPGFDLVGEMGVLAARPLHPVAFPGDVAIRAERVTAPSDDFNVMTAAHLPQPEVRVISTPTDLVPSGTLAVFALEKGTAAGIALGRYDLLLTDAPVTVSGPAIAVQLPS